PDTLRYVPPNATNFFISSSLDKLWATSTAHVGAFFHNPLTNTVSKSEIRKQASDIQKSFENLCLGWYESEDLKNNGIDTSRGVVVATFGPSIFDKNSTIKSAMLAIPVSNKELFKRTFTSLSNSSKVVLEATNTEHKVVKFQISRSLPYQGRLCGKKKGSEKGSNRVIEVLGTDEFSASPEGTLKLNFFPDISIDSTLQFACTAVYADGSHSNCRCRIEGKDCSQHVFKKEDIQEDPVVAGKQYEGISIDNDDLMLIFADSKTAIISTNRETLENAMEDTQRNLDFYRNWDALIQDFSTIGHNLKSTDSILIGGIRSPGIPLTTHVPVAIRIGLDQLQFSTAINIDHWNMRLLERFTNYSADPLDSTVTIPEGTGAGVVLTDDYLNYYLAFLFDYVKDAPEFLKKYLGNFQVVLEELANTSTVESVGLYLVGMDDGIPELAMAVRTDKNAADNLLFQLQKKLRVERDKVILKNALTDYRKESETKQKVTIANLTQKSNLQENKKTYIEAEAVPLWSYYKIQGDKINSQDDKLDASSFANESYQFKSNGY
ncbi:MAG: hypothetical protein R3240_12765, partial [Gammaproteobacteria bacterium]|nr:hypothetical protein [Gammaproteobacteria bacterium]